MRRLVICEGYHQTTLPEENPVGLPEPIPWTTTPHKDGWKLVSGKHFDLHGVPVWLCPECLKRFEREEKKWEDAQNVALVG